MLMRCEHRRCRMLGVTSQMVCAAAVDERVVGGRMALPAVSQGWGRLFYYHVPSRLSLWECPTEEDKAKTRPRLGSQFHSRCCDAVSLGSAVGSKIREHSDGGSDLVLTTTRRNARRRGPKRTWCSPSSQNSSSAFASRYLRSDSAPHDPYPSFQSDPASSPSFPSHGRSSHSLHVSLQKAILSHSTSSLFNIGSVTCDTDARPTDNHDALGIQAPHPLRFG
eukprot:1373155-Rhodomonas_salina.3